MRERARQQSARRRRGGGRRTLGRWGCAGLLAAAEIALAAVAFAVAVPSAQAQFFPFGGDDSYRRQEYQRPPRPRQPVRGYQQQPQQQPGWFGFPGFGWGGPPPRQQYEQQDQPPPRRTRPANVESTRPPPPRKREVEPTTHIVVIGDTMSEWLAAGLDEAFADTPEIGVTRNSKIAASLLRSDGRDTTDAGQAIREALAGEKADFVVMMTGIGDRHAIRERDKPAEPEKKENGAAQPSVAAPERERRAAVQTYEFRSDKWAEIYAKHVDEAIAALKSKGVPVIWVGLPPVRGPRSRADLTFLNDLYKDRAEKAGILYVDVWDGFMEESGEFSSYGPDVLGQVRRLRTSDGVNFTKPGARKLAHFVDREIKRLQQKAAPVALPAPEDAPKELVPAPGPGGVAPRPVAGPVVPLTGAAPANAGALAGAGRDSAVPDTAAARVLIEGEAVAPTQGRADDFSWSPVSAAAAQDVAPPVEPAPPAAARTAPSAARPGPGPGSRGRRPPTQQRSEARGAASEARPVR